MGITGETVVPTIFGTVTMSRTQAGKPYDTTTGMYNYDYRDYQPETARFTTVDPIRDGNNWFAYVNNDPVNYVDPLGLQCISANDPKNNWIDNGNGTYTAKPGATLSGLYGSDWQEQSGFTRDPRTLQIGETVGTPTLPTPSPTPVPAPKAPAAPVPTPVVPTPQASTIINNSSPSLRDTYTSWKAKPDGAALTKNEATLQQGLGYGIMALGAAGVFSGQAVLVGIPVMGAGTIVVGKGIEGIKVSPATTYIQVLSPVIGTIGEIPLVNPFP